jgi:hypothetical protein
MTCPTCDAPIIPGEHPTITLPDGTVYHAPMWWREPLPPDAPEDTPENEPVLLFADCAPVPEPGEPAPPPAPEPRYILSVLEFTTGRFTQAERERIELAMDLHPDPRTRVRLRLLDKDLQNSGNKQIDVRDPRTQMGVGFLTTVVYEGAPLLVPSRVPVILAPA